MYVERLGAMISEAVMKGDWLPINLSINGSKIPHLFFADDVFLFTKATVSQAMVENFG